MKKYYSEFDCSKHDLSQKQVDKHLEDHVIRSRRDKQCISSETQDIFWLLRSIGLYQQLKSDCQQIGIDKAQHYCFEKIDDGESVSAVVHGNAGICSIRNHGKILPVFRV